MLKVGQVKEIYEMKGAGRSIRGIAGELGIARNTARRYLKSPEAMRPKPRPSRGSKVDAYTEYVDRRLSEGLENCVVLHREFKALGYAGGYSILTKARFWQSIAGIPINTQVGITSSPEQACTSGTARRSSTEPSTAPSSTGWHKG